MLQLWYLLVAPWSRFGLCRAFSWQGCCRGGGERAAVTCPGAAGLGFSRVKACIDNLSVAMVVTLLLCHFPVGGTIVEYPALLHGISQGENFVQYGRATAASLASRPS